MPCSIQTLKSFKYVGSLSKSFHISAIQTVKYVPTYLAVVGLISTNFSFHISTSNGICLSQNRNSDLVVFFKIISTYWKREMLKALKLFYRKLEWLHLMWISILKVENISLIIMFQMDLSAKSLSSSNKKYQT